MHRLTELTPRVNSEDRGGCLSGYQRCSEIILLWTQKQLVWTCFGGRSHLRVGFWVPLSSCLWLLGTWRGGITDAAWAIGEVPFDWRCSRSPVLSFGLLPGSTTFGDSRRFGYCFLLREML